MKAEINVIQLTVGTAIYSSVVAIKKLFNREASQFIR